MDGSAIVAAREGTKRASDGKTVMGSESEDNYNDRGPHKRERSSRVSAGGGAGIRGCERVERKERERTGLISSKEKEDEREVGQDEGLKG